MLEKIYLKTQILYGIIIAYIEELEEIQKTKKPANSGPGQRLSMTGPRI